MLELFITTILAIALSAVGWGLQMWDITSKTVGMALFSIGVMLLFVAAYLWIRWLRKKKQKPKEDTRIVSTAESKQSIKEVKIEVSETNYDYIGDKKCFLVTITLILKSTVVPLHLGWLRLVIAGKAFDSVSSKPPLTDKIEHTQQKYELEYEVDVDTFLKGRFADSNTTRHRPNCWGHILANAGGTDWKSEEFEIVQPLTQ